MPSVLVTGAEGFIGSPLVGSLLAAGHAVVGIDIKPSARVADAYQHYVLDITQGDELHSLLRKIDSDAVFHLAALHYIPYCNAHPNETVATNVLGTRYLLEICEEIGVRRFFFASTAAVYRPAEVAHVEASEVLPIDIYGTTKAFGEQLVRASAARGTMKAVIARLFNVYGPHDPNPHVVPELVGQIRQRLYSDDLFVEAGNLAPARDYVHVNDAVDAIHLLGLADVSGEFNVGSGVGTSVTGLVHALRKIIGRAIDVRQLESRQRRVDRMSLVADVSLIEQQLQWRPRVALEDGLRALLETP